MVSNEHDSKAERQSAIAGLLTGLNCNLAYFFLGINCAALLLATTTTQTIAEESPLFQQESVISTSRDYGAASGTLQRIEDLLRAGQYTLSTGDYYDYRSRLYSLKQSAQLELSKGEEAVGVNHAALKLEQEVTNTLRGSGKRGHLEGAFTKLELDYKNRKHEFNNDDAKHFQDAITQLKGEIQQHFTNMDDPTADKYMQEIHELESKMTDKVIFGSRRGGSLFARREHDLPMHKEGGDSPFHERTKSGSGSESKGDGNGDGKDSHAKHVDRPANGFGIGGASGSGASNRQSDTANDDGTKDTGNGIAADSIENAASEGKTHHLPRAPKKPPVPIHKIIEKIEFELLEFHEKNQIGSFDMDSFTEKLLAQKKNLHVMMSKTGRISARQEHLIRAELEKLQEDLTSRVLGKD